MAREFDVFSRVSKLLNNEKFSDVEFLVKSPIGNEKFYAHLLILATSSETFAKSYHENSEKANSKKMKIKVPYFIYPFIVPPATVHVMLRYLYTDYLDLDGFENACALYALSKYFRVEDLACKCINFLMDEIITVENVISLLNCFLRENKLLKVKSCEKFIQRETKKVLASKYFCYASDDAVSNIVKLDSMNIDSELDVVNALLRWCWSNCGKKNLPQNEESLYTLMLPFLKDLRFLTLTPEEYLNFVDANSFLFTQFESAIITKNILQPSKNINLPQRLCSIATKRSDSKPLQKKILMEYPEREFRDKSNKSLVYTAKPSSNIQSAMSISHNQFVPSSYIQSAMPISDNQFAEPSSNIQSAMSISYNQSAPSSNIQSAMPISYSIFAEPSSNIQSAVPSSYNQFEKPVNRNGPLFIPKNYNSRTNRMNFPDNRTITSVSPKIMTFNFPLENVEKDISSAFEKAIKCSMKFKMIRGSILIHGLQLSIREKKTELDSLEVILCYKGFPEKNPKELVFEQKLTSSIFEIKLDSPLKLEENQHGEMEVTIEGLRLERCKVCSIANQRCELNNGCYTSSEIEISSNQNRKENFFFLISRIDYSVL